MGNLRSVSKALEHVGADVVITRDPATIRGAAKIVLPGVGAFRKCMDNLAHYGLVEIVREQIQSGKPFLGICLGLQLLFEESEEFGSSPGLGIFKGRVVKFDFAGKHTAHKIPHMGWNQVRLTKTNPLFSDIADGTEFYFVHSYHVAPADPAIIASQTEYGYDFCSMIRSENVFACQFHPEKSQKAGLKLLANFAALAG